MIKTFIMIGMVAGSYAGAYLPLLWGDSALSISSLLFGAVGGFAGIYLGYALAKRFDF
jgi:hypothetical protein